MARRLWTFFSLAIFLAGLVGLGLTYYAWFGAWPQSMKEIVDHQRSVAENTGRSPDPLLIGIADRTGATDLGGIWQAVIDPYGRGEMGGIAPRAHEPQTPSDLAEFSFENGLTLEVPGDWNSQDERLVFYQGVVWYKRTFDLDRVAGRRYVLHFGAANYGARVYVNGRLLGEHEGGFTPFNFDVTDVLESGENLLVVRVDNRRSDDDVPTPLTDWHNYGGLTRDVTLLDLPSTFVRSWELQLDPSSPDRIKGFVQLDGKGRPPVSVEIPELGLQVEAQPDEAGRVEVDVAAGPVRWSPENPKLYDVSITAGEDRVVDEIGFRTIEARGAKILLNGEPLFLRGVSVHEEALGGAGRIHDAEQARALFDVMSELGANFARLAHYTHDESMVREADRRGFLVWAEIPVYWNIAFDDPRTLERAKTQLSEMIARDRNRASVVLWSIGNETPPTAERNAFMQALAAHVNGEDSSRLITAAMVTGPEALLPFMTWYFTPALLGWSPEEWVFEINDPLGDFVDVPAFNEYFGWYYSGAVGQLSPISSRHARRTILENLDRVQFAFGQDKPVIVSEFGAGAKVGMHAPAEDLAVYTEEFQALVYERQLEMIDNQSMVAGISPWVLKDFRSPMRLYQGVQDYWNRKGLVDDAGTKKMAFEVLREYYRDRAARDAS